MKTISGCLDLALLLSSGRRIFRSVLLSACYLLLCTVTINAQNYKWVKGGGSTTPMTYSRDWQRATKMCTDDNGNIYVVSPVGDDNITAGTFVISKSSFGDGGNNPHMLLATYNCIGGFRWAKLIESYYWTYGTGIAYSNGSIYITGIMMSDSGFMLPNAYTKYFGFDTIVHDVNHNDFIARYDTAAI